MSGRRAILALGSLSVGLVALAADDAPTTNPQSRLATIEALVHEHSFVIDDSVFAGTIDKVQMDGHFYSTKPPLWSTFGAGVYAALHLFGLSFKVNPTLTAWVLSLMLGLLPHVLLLIYAACWLAQLDLRPQNRVLGFAALSLGYLGLAYATTINNHTPAATAALAALYHARRARLKGQRRDLWLAGLFAGIAPTLDLGAVFVSIAVGLMLLRHDWRRTMRHFAPAALPPLTLHFALTFAVSKSLLPIYLQKELYLYPGSYWLAPTGMDALSEPRWLYAFHMLLGHHGVLTMTPLVALGLWAAWRARRDAELAPEAAIVLATFVTTATFYLFTTTNYGGTCTGFRWLLPAAALTLAFVGRWLEDHSGRAAQVAFLCLFLVSLYNAVDALANPWETSGWHELWRADAG